MITKLANSLMAPIHDRMLVILLSSITIGARYGSGIEILTEETGKRVR